jgi:Zn-dependent M28 family amino/carboxypeptidase
MKPVLAACLAAIAAAVASGAISAAHRHGSAGESPISAKRMAEDVTILSSDAFQGRGPATPGEAKTVDWLVAQLKAMGLKPGGPDGQWTQEVPLIRFDVPLDAKMSMGLGDWSRPLVQGQDAVAVTMRPVDRVRIENASLVFVGYGVSAPEKHWDDFKGVDLKGKIAVVLINNPDFENPASTLFGGKTKAMTYYGRWTYKYEEAVRRGALGVLIVHETRGAGYDWKVVRNSNTGPQYDIVRSDPAAEKLLMQGWIQRDIAVDLFKRAGLDFEAEKEKAKAADFRPVVLEGAHFSADYPVTTAHVTTHNVLGRLPGTRHPDETVIYSAHWDHFGVGQPDARGDPIFHGAADDGTGDAAVLEIARAFSRAPRTDRSVLFAFWTVEERGLLGSAHYAAHPVWPLARTVADINLDILQTAGPAHDLVLVGPGKDTLEDNLAAVAKKHGRYVTPESRPEAGLFYRGDQFSFAKMGVPVIPFMENSGGADLVKGGRAAGEAWVTEYVSHRYHTPEDRITPDWDLRGAADDAGLAYELGRGLATSRAWPEWKPGSEFAAARQASEGERRGR